MRIGIDIGGTGIEAIALNDDGRASARERMAVPVGTYDATIHAVLSLVKGLEARLARRGSVGVGIPGTISPASGVVKNTDHGDSSGDRGATWLWLSGGAPEAER
jgi:fructokinase